MSNASPPLVTTREAAEILGVSVFQVARLAQRGELRTAVQAPGKRGARFFDRADVETFIASRRTEAAS